MICISVYGSCILATPNETVNFICNHVSLSHPLPQMSASQPQLSISASFQAQFSPCGRLLAASSSDPGLPSLLLLNSLTWRRIVEFPMTSLLFLGSSEAASLEINKEKKRNNNNKMDHNERHPDAILYKEISK